MSAALHAAGAPAPHGQGADSAPCVITVHSHTAIGTTLLLRLAGEIDLCTAAPVRSLLAAAVADGYKGLVLDTSRVTFCDSALLAILDWWPCEGRRLRHTARSAAVDRLLDLVADAAGRAASGARPPGPVVRTAAERAERHVPPPTAAGSRS